MKAREHLLAAGVHPGANQQRREPSFPKDGAKFFPNDTRSPYEWMPRSFQRRRSGSVQQCFNPHSVGSHLPDAGDGDVGAGCGGGATDAVAPFASFEATCGPTTFSARGGSESYQALTFQTSGRKRIGWRLSLGKGEPNDEKPRLECKSGASDRLTQYVSGAGDGIRTHDLLHGKQML